MSPVNIIAEHLNKELEDTCVAELLSDIGRRIYFPRGVVAQTAEAAKRAHRFDATVGIATDGSKPLFLSGIRSLVPELEPDEIFNYAPTAGLPLLRKKWLSEMYEKNPSLQGSLLLPVVTTGLTHGITIAADLFIDQGDCVLVPDLFWGNYRLVIEERRQALLKTFPFFDRADKLNLPGLAVALSQTRVGEKVVLLFNFPNNPTGYTPSKTEMSSLTKILQQTAERGVNLVVICDDAYFGLFYESDSCHESLFASLSKIHERLLAVKIDGTTKENYAWGFRIGFITLSAKGLSEQHFSAIEQKIMGLVRSSVSSSSRLSQSLLLRGMTSERYQDDLTANLQRNRNRYLAVRDILAHKSKKTDPLQPLPFNSGYFLTFRIKDEKAEMLRLELLKRGVGTISVGSNYLRVAFSTVAEKNLEALFVEIYDVAFDIFGRI